MDDKLKVLWNLDVLVKMCRSKSDGPSLRVEETEIKEKIKNHQQEIDEIRSLSDEDSYDTSAEMADRNIEIITKKQLQTLKNELKEKNKELNNLKDEESNAYESTNLLRNNKASYEKYIVSMQERLNSTVDQETINRYNDIISETEQKIEALIEELNLQNDEYETIQNEILTTSNEIEVLEDKIDKKKRLLEETQSNLNNKENYIDKTKREKNDKKINDLQLKIENLNNRLEEIKKDPKYIETKIKDVINSDEDPINAREYLIDLLNIVIRQPYINVPDDNNLEEELLRATQARDSFANEVEQKSYNILEARTPEKTRIEFLEARIDKWHNEQEKLQQEIDLVDKDELFHYKDKYKEIASMIRVMKNDLKEFQKAYEQAPDSNISLKAGLKVFLEEKREDIIEAEKIATLFRNDESEDINEATKKIKYKFEELNNNIINAQEEINNIKNRLMSKKAGLIDITSRNKDKDTLKELAQIVIDLKHRRQFPETPIEIIKRLEKELNIDLLSEIDYEIINQSNTIVPHNYDEFITSGEVLDEDFTDDEDENQTNKRGVKVIEEVTIDNPDLINQSVNDVTSEADEEVIAVDNSPEETIIEENNTEDEQQQTTPEESELLETPEEENIASEDIVEENEAEPEISEEIESDNIESENIENEAVEETSQSSEPEIEQPEELNNKETEHEDIIPNEINIESFEPQEIVPVEPIELNSSNEETEEEPIELTPSEENSNTENSILENLSEPADEPSVDEIINNYMSESNNQNGNEETNDSADLTINSMFNNSEKVSENNESTENIEEPSEETNIADSDNKES